MGAGISAAGTRVATSNGAAAEGAVIEPCRDADQLRAYIDEHWRRGHVLARDERMFRFTYMTPWVDRRVFPAGISVLGIYDGAARGSRMLGFLGAIIAPYPRPRSYWLALWHVLPELKGGGVGGRLLQRMQEIALNDDAPDGRGGWIGTFGAGPEALPVYLKRGYCVRAARRWVFDPTRATGARPSPASTALNTAERTPPAEWSRYRFEEHPVFKYERRPGGQGSVFRTEENAWGVVTHCARLDAAGGTDDVVDVYRRESARAGRLGRPYLMDAWSFDPPTGTAEGSGWSLAPDDLPSVFHPPEARGNTIYAVGRPFIPAMIHKGDCDQDRPN